MAAVKLNPSAKGLMALIIIAGAIFVSCALGYVAAAGKMRAIADDLAAKQTKVEESTQIAQKLEKSKYTYEDTKSQIRFLETSVSTEAYVPTLLSQLEQLAKSVNLKVTEVRPSVEVKASTKPASTGTTGASDNKNKDAQAKEPAPKPYDELHITVQFKGNYTNVLDFLYKLTTFPKILAVNSVSISPSETQLSYAKPPVLSVKMVVTAFVLKRDDPPTLPGSLKAQPLAGSVSGASEGRAKHEAG